MVKRKRRTTQPVERHHRRPSSRGGTGHVRNISMVRRSEHRAFHLLFGNMLADEVAAMLTDTWIDPDYYLVAIPYHKGKPSPRRTRMYCTTCQCEVLKHVHKTCKQCK